MGDLSYYEDGCILLGTLPYFPLIKNLQQSFGALNQYGFMFSNLFSFFEIIYINDEILQFVLNQDLVKDHRAHLNKLEI